MIEVSGSGSLSGSFTKIFLLLWADILAAYAVWMMMICLTDAWKMNFTLAAAIVNLFQGTATVMPVAISFLADTFFGHYWVLLLSSVAYSIGLGFLAMSTPPVLSDATGTHNTYEPACIGDIQKILFYASMALIALGLAGHIVSLGTFLAQQIIAHQNDTIEAEGQNVYTILAFFAVILVPLVSATALPYIKPWSIRFGIPAICTVVATLVFVSGSGSYVSFKPTGSPLTRVFRVCVASALKIHLLCPKNVNELYEKHDLGDELVPHSSGLRCLDKAAIITSSQSLEEQEKNKWKLCRVTEVEETKMTLRMIPMWMTFIAIGLVMSIGNTFFLEQANHMNRKVGRWKVPLPIFLMFKDTTKSQATKSYHIMASCWSESRRRYAPPTGIALGMIFSVLCCITAAKVEDRRIGVIKKHGLLDRPDDTIPMSIFWLLPQFLLLAALEGFARESVKCFFRDQLPSSMVDYMTFYTQGVFGTGIISGVLSVYNYIAGKVSKQGTRPSWFGDTLNKSRLDNYSWTLAALSSINLIIYAFLIIWYVFRESRANDEEPPEEEGNTDFNEMCCCC